MLDWIFEGIITWISSIASSLMGRCIWAVPERFRCRYDRYGGILPLHHGGIHGHAVYGVAILFLITVWQLFRTFGGPITEAEHPLHLIARSSILPCLSGMQDRYLWWHWTLRVLHIQRSWISA